MIIFKVVERVLGVGPRKGQKAYGAEPKAPLKFSQEWLIDRIVRETSLSEGDVRNVLITLRNIIIEVVTLGGALDLGDIFSLRVVVPSKQIEKEIDVTATSALKPAKLMLTWKDTIRRALKQLQVEVDNPKRKKEKKKEEGGIGQHGN